MTSPLSHRWKRVVVLHSAKLSDTQITKAFEELNLENELSSAPRIPCTKPNANSTKITSLDYLSEPDNYNTVILFFQHPDDEELWRVVVNDAKSRDRYVELILIVLGGSLNATKEALRGGYYAYFEEQYEPFILAGHINATLEIINYRKNRYGTSRELNKHVDNLGESAQAVLDQIRNLVKYDRATLSLLSERDYINDKDKDDIIGRSVRTLLHKVGYDETDWKLHRPVKDDQLIQAVLRGELKRRVFSDAKHELENYGWDYSLTGNVKSWIVLPLRYLDEIVGIITLDTIENGHNGKIFDYTNTNEVTLRQFANQAALTILSAQQSEATKRLETALTTLVGQIEQEKILTTIALEAAKLVDGSISYVVLPNEAKKYLAIKTDSKHSYTTHIIEIAKFPIYDSEEKIQKEDGITALAHVRRKIVIRDDCTFEFGNGETAGSLSYYDPVATRAWRQTEYEESFYTTTKSNISIPILDKERDKYDNQPIFLDKLRDILRLQEDKNDEQPTVLGVINIEHPNPCAFTEIQIETLETFADFAAIAIKNHKINQQIQRLGRIRKGARFALSGLTLIFMFILAVFSYILAPFVQNPQNAPIRIDVVLLLSAILVVTFVLGVLFDRFWGIKEE